MKALLWFAMGCANAQPPASSDPLVFTDVVAVLPAGRSITAPSETSGVMSGSETEASVSVEVRANTTSWKIEDGEMLLQGDVHAIRGDTELTCDTAVVYLGSSGSIDRIEATGTVQIRQASRTARGARAVLESADGKVSLFGDAVVEDDGRRMEGEPIVFFLDRDEIRCDDCRLQLQGLDKQP